MASVSAIAQMKAEAAQRENAVIEQIGGRDAVQRIEKAGSHSRQVEYNEARRSLERAKVLEEFLQSGKIGEEADIESLDGVGTEVAQALKNAGFGTRDAIRQASNEDLLEVSGIGNSLLKKIRGQL